MKKIVPWIFYLLCVAVFCRAQETVENPAKPLSKNFGRRVALEKRMEIRDIGREFYFKYPHNLKVAPNGTIFVQDQEQFIQFDPNGKFVRNIFKKGQGPGEMQSAGNYFFDGENIIIHESWTDKILLFDSAGKLIKEFRIQGEPSLSRFLLFREGTYYFLSSDRPVTKKTSVFDIHQKLIAIAQEGKEINERAEFPTKGFIAVGKQGGRIFYDISSVIAVPYKNRYLFVSHTQEYLLKLYDAEKKQVTKIFKRVYRRMKTPTDAEITGGAMLDGKSISPPRQKFLNDIQNLFVLGDRLWVVTSTMDKKKGTLVDVFDSEGKYIDNFYLKFPAKMVRGYHGNTAMDISKNFLHTLEQEDEGTYLIRKYEIIDKT